MGRCEGLQRAGWRLGGGRAGGRAPVGGGGRGAHGARTLSEGGGTLELPNDTVKV